MTFKRWIPTTLIALAIGIFLIIGVGQQPTIAAPLTGTLATQEKVQPSQEPFALQTEVDRALSSIPSGYYTIRTVQNLKSQLEDNQPVLVDVREPSEYQLGHIPNAINIPLRGLADNLDKIPSDRPVILYCSSGYRSGMGVMALHLLGYENVQGFPPSFVGWKDAGEDVSLFSTR
jgi:rhodanese-related sulfurtransferase